MKYIDIHSHISFPDYDTDREEVIARAQEAGVGIITVGTDLESSQKAIILAETHENMWAIIGLHPVDAGESSIAGGVFDYESFKKLALHPKVVAIGECGLDYFHTPFNAEFQREVFIQHIKLANEVKKPLMLHVRNAKNTNGNGVINTGKNAEGNAYQDALTLLKEHAHVPFNFHFFAGTAADLKNIIDAGGYISFTGVVTFTHDYDELVRIVPLDRIMSETDAPFVSPQPYRGKRNEPVYVIEVAKKISEIRRGGLQKNDQIITQNMDDTLRALVDNAKKFFNI